MEHYIESPLLSDSATRKRERAPQATPQGSLVKAFLSFVQRAGRRREGRWRLAGRTEGRGEGGRERLMGSSATYPLRLDHSRQLLLERDEERGEGGHYRAAWSAKAGMLVRFGVRHFAFHWSERRDEAGG